MRALGICRRRANRSNCCFLLRYSAPEARTVEFRQKTMEKTSTQPGDRFLRAGNPPTAWIVERIVNMPDMPPHVRLFREDRPTQTLFIGMSVLSDNSQFRRLTAEQKHP